MKTTKVIFTAVIFLSLVVIPVFYTGCSDSGNTILPPPPPPGGGIVTDIDSNVYQVVQIGDQVWMAENLKTTRYNDGVTIPNVTSDSQWVKLTTGAWVNYNNQISNDTVYGKLYNWYALGTGKLCPQGWRIPSNADWTVLTNYLGGESVAGGKMKSTGTQYWHFPNTGATNESGFSGLPGGTRNITVVMFDYISLNGFWWSSTELGTDIAWNWSLDYSNGTVDRSDGNKSEGSSCRCIME